MRGFRCALLEDFRNSLMRLSPTAVASFGRNEDDAYEAVIIPDHAKKDYQQVVWKLLPRGSFFTPHRGVVTCRIASGEKGLTWIGCEAVVPHDRRGDFIEACYGLFDRESVTQGFLLIRKLFAQMNEGTINCSDTVGGNTIHWECDKTSISCLDLAYKRVRAGKRVNVRVPRIGESVTRTPRPDVFQNPNSNPIFAAIGSAVEICGAVFAGIIKVLGR